MFVRRTLACLVATVMIAGLLAACDDDGTDDAGAPTKPAAIDGNEVGAANLDIIPGVRIVAVTGADAGAELALVDSDGMAVGRGSTDQSDDSLGYGVADDEGKLTFRVVPPGEDYEVRVATGDDEYVVSDTITVLDIDDVADQSFYEGQELTDGYQYIETRDGTTLAAMVRLPGPIDEGPYPTMIEYSGYNPAAPIEYSGSDPASVAAALEEGAQSSSAIWSLLGYATVGVNMRGTGCSGGSYDLFDPASTADGYDIVETVAAQDWVANNEVGMVGVSFPGITQLYTASTQPPSLAAITPLSVTDDMYRGTGYPGGIFNNGFAQRWLTERVEQARSVLLPPAPKGSDEAVGQAWARERAEEGDEICAENQELRSTNIDAYDLIEENQYIVPEWVDDRILWDMVHRIEVPVFLAGAWQDEQTGGHFPDMLANFRDDIPMRAVLTNGAHIDSLGPWILPQVVAFNSMFVADEVPEEPAVWGLVPILFEMLLDADSGPIPDIPFTDEPDAVAAREAFETQDRVQILFESGAGYPDEPGTLQPVFEATFSAWPIPEVEATTWYLGPDGTLATEEPDGEGTDLYTPDAEARPETNLPGTSDSDAWVPLPRYEWDPLVEGAAVAYLSEPLDDATVMVGTGSLDVWVRTNVADTDLQATLTEVRDDGEEVYIQNGWLRASHRALDEEHSSELAPRHTHLEDDAAEMPDGELELLRVQIWPFAHVFREGSQIRVSIQAPGGDRQRWRFATFAYDEDAEVEVAWGDNHTSSVVLPVVPDVTASGDVPPCWLRGQPCRPYVPWSNQSAGGSG